MIKYNFFSGDQDIDISKIVGDLSPSWGPFSFAQNTVGSLFHVVSATCFAYILYHLFEGVARLSNAKRDGNYDGLRSSKKEIGLAIIALIVLSSITMIINEVLNMK